MRSNLPSKQADINHQQIQEKEETTLRWYWCINEDPLFIEGGLSFFDTLPVAVNQKASAIGKRLNVSKKEINQTLYRHGELFSSTFFVWKLRSWAAGFYQSQIVLETELLTSWIDGRNIPLPEPFLPSDNNLLQLGPFLFVFSSCGFPTAEPWSGGEVAQIEPPPYPV